jgi:hypothetical protein
MGRHEKIVDKPTPTSFSHDIWAGGTCAMFVEVLKRSVMAERGQWVWQPERPRTQGRDDGLGFRTPYQPPQFRLLAPARPPS